MQIICPWTAPVSEISNDLILAQRCRKGASTPTVPFRTSIRRHCDEMVRARLPASEPNCLGAILAGGTLYIRTALCLPVWRSIMRKLALCAGAALIVLGSVGSADAQYRYRQGYYGGGGGHYPYAYRGSGRGGAVAAGVIGGLVLGGLA